jgi:hypothetical protein
MTDQGIKGPRWNRRQLFGGSFAALAAGTVAAVLPELGANAAVRGSRAGDDASWYLEAPARQVELDSSATSQATTKIGALARGSQFVASSALTTTKGSSSKSVIRTMHDGRTIHATGVAMGDSHILTSWSESLADGTPGRNASIVHHVTNTSMTVVAVGGTPETLESVPNGVDHLAAPAASAVKCATGTHLLRYCTNLKFDSFAACCGGCVVAFVGSPIAGGLCALIVCTSCYSVNCKKYANTCVINS